MIALNAKRYINPLLFGVYTWSCMIKGNIYLNSFLHVEFKNPSVNIFQKIDFVFNSQTVCALKM